MERKQYKGPVFQKEINDYISQFKNEYYVNMRNVSQVSKEIFSDWISMKRFCDAFICSFYDQRNLSYLNVDIEKMRKTIRDCYGLSYKDYDETSEIANNIMVPVLDVVNQYIKKKVEGKQGPKLLLYFAHDKNIAALVSYAKKKLGQLDYNLYGVPFASSITIEIRRRDNGSISVGIFWNEDQIILYEPVLDDHFLKLKRRLTAQKLSRKYK